MQHAVHRSRDRKNEHEKSNEAKIEQRVRRSDGRCPSVRLEKANGRGSAEIETATTNLFLLALCTSESKCRQRTERVDVYFTPGGLVVKAILNKPQPQDLSHQLFFSTVV